jgi:hypothetical protein
VTKAKKLLAGLLGALAMIVVPATSMAQSRGASSPWYAGFHFGQADIDEADEFDKMFAAELAYTSFGEVQGVKGNAIELVGVAGWPVADRFSVYGKLGFARGEFKAGGLSDDSIELTYGIGVRYDFAPNMGARLEWQSYPDVGDGASDVSVMSIGLVFKF